MTGSGRGLREVLFLACLGGLSLPFFCRAGDAGDQTVRIGYLEQLSPTAKALAQEILNGARLAVNEANQPGGEEPGFKVELVEREVLLSAPSVTQAASQLCSDPRVVAVVGHLSAETASLASSVFAEKRLGFLVPLVTNPKFTQRGLNNVFRFCATDEDLGGKAAKFCLKTLKKKKAVILYEKAFNGEVLALSFQQSLRLQKVRELLFEKVGSSDSDEALVSRVKGLGPNLVFFGVDLSGRPSWRLK